MYSLGTLTALIDRDLLMILLHNYNHFRRNRDPDNTHWLKVNAN